jgi:hypothetical protein
MCPSFARIRRRLPRLATRFVAITEAVATANRLCSNPLDIHRPKVLPARKSVDAPKKLSERRKAR